MLALDQKVLQVLKNRYGVMKIRAKGKTDWPTFKDWLDDFEEVAPSEFSIDTHRIRYDPEFGYTKQGMRVEIPSKRAVRQPLPEDSRVLLAAELTMLLLDGSIDLSLDELVAEVTKRVKI